MHGALIGTQVVYLMRCLCVDLEGDLSEVFICLYVHMGWPLMLVILSCFFVDGFL
jgi:hypothetical protein